MAGDNRFTSEDEGRLMALDQYRRKRDFRKTSEPSPRTPAKKKPGWRFVVQKHAASRLHYDFRLELDGVLKSWAVPKGPSLDPKVKSLAVEVEDHPIDYAKFEGIIPTGQYGGGTVLVWDEGQWEPEGDPREGLKKGDLKFTLHGKKLNGSWVLVRMRKEGQRNNWLLIKHRDEDSIAGDEHGLVEREPASVVTERTIEEIAEDADRVWTKEGEKKRRPQKVKGKSRARKAESAHKVDPASIPGAQKARLPKKISPQLATLDADVPQGDDWLHEIKFDGYRLVCWIDGDDVRLVTRKGNDWTNRFPDLARALKALRVEQAILDGEVVALDEHGATSFQKLQSLITAHDEGDLILYAFDLMHLNGYDLRKSPLIERKQALAELLQARFPQNNGTIRYSDHVRGNGRQMFEEACNSAIEGIVCKRPEGKYEERRSRSWLKIKCHNRQEFVIAGYTKPEGSRVGFGALALGYYEGRRLMYAGRVGTGFNHETLIDLAKRLKGMTVDEIPFATKPPASERKGVTWVRPELVAEVRFAGWTEEGVLRHSAFQGLREDKAAKDVVREQPVLETNGKASAMKKSSSPKKREGKRSSTPETKAGNDVAGVAITHADRVVYPDLGITKGQIAEYYAAVEDWILPDVVDRPLTIVRCPQGQGKQSFYQKHWVRGFPEAVDKVWIEERDDAENYVVIHDLAGLVSLVQMNALEFHPWSARVDRLDAPDQIIFDLDPGPGVEWKSIVQAATDVHDLLSELGLKSFVRTSGGKGLHVVAPLGRRNDWDEVRSFAANVATGMAVHAGERYVANMRKDLRQGKIFVDFLRNQRGATAVASYSTRNRPSAGVATPVHWNELPKLGSADAFTMLSVPERLRNLKSDPWDGFHTVRQSLTKKVQQQAKDIAQGAGASSD